MRVALSFELNCSRNNKQQPAGPIQEDVWTRNEFEDTTPPPPYCEYPGLDVQPGAGFNLVCQCSVNTNLSQRSLESKSETKSRKARASVKKLIRPMTKMFKTSSKQVGHSSVEQTSTQWNPPFTPEWEWLVLTGSSAEPNVEYHEMTTDRIVSELPGGNRAQEWPNTKNINELDDTERPVGELEGSVPEGQVLQRSQPTAYPPMFTQERNHSNPVSPMSIPSDRMQCPPRAIDNLVLDQQYYSPMSPESLISPVDISASHEHWATPRQPLAQVETSLPVSMVAENKSVQLEAGPNICGQAKSSPTNPGINRNYPSWCRFPAKRNSDSPPREEVSHASASASSGFGPAQLGNQRGYFEDCRRAEEASEQPKTERNILNEDGELAVLWDSPVIQEPLIGMVESIIYQLRPQGSKVLRMLEGGVKGVSKKWNERFRHQWNGRGDLSAKDLPLFLEGWATCAHTINNDITNPLRYSNDTSRLSSTPWPQQNNAVDHVNVTTDLPYRYPDLVRPIESADGGNVPCEHGGDFAMPMTRSTSGSPSWTGNNSRTSWTGSPPKMHRRFSSATSASTTTNDLMWNSSSCSASQISTPSTEYSNPDEVFEFDHCRLDGCNARFSGETRDVRKGNHTRHMNSKHGGERFYCNACPSSYNRDDNLLGHKRKRHPDQILPPPKKKRTVKREGTTGPTSTDED